MIEHVVGRGVRGHTYLKLQRIWICGDLWLPMFWKDAAFRELLLLKIWLCKILTKIIKIKGDQNNEKKKSKFVLRKIIQIWCKPIYCFIYLLAFEGVKEEKVGSDYSFFIQRLMKSSQSNQKGSKISYIWSLGQNLINELLLCRNDSQNDASSISFNLFKFKVNCSLPHISL